MKGSLLSPTAASSKTHQNTAATFLGFFVKNCKVISTNVIDTAEASDHRAVRMVIPLP